MLQPEQESEQGNRYQQAQRGVNIPYLITDNAADSRNDNTVKKNDVPYKYAYDRHDKADKYTDC